MCIRDRNTLELNQISKIWKFSLAKPPKLKLSEFKIILDIYNAPGRLYFLDICPSWTSLLSTGRLLILMCSPSRTFISVRTLIRHARVLKPVFLKKVLGKIAWPRNLQKLPRWNEWNQRGSFCKFLDDVIFPSTFLKKTDFRVLAF